MKIAGLFILLIGPLILSGQTQSPTLAPGPTFQVASYSRDSTGMAPIVNGATDPQSQQLSKPSKRVRSEKAKEDSLVGSMVGYIDDAIVQSQFRVRFDAGFDNPRPDRAEYFYAGNNGASVSTGPPQQYINFQQLYFDGEYAPFRRFSLIAEVPFRWIQPYFLNGARGDLSSGGGISDVQVGMKFSVIATGSRDLTIQLRAGFPSGDGGRGLGTNHYHVDPMVLYFQRLSPRLSVEAELGDTHPIGGVLLASPPHTGFSGDVLTYGVGPSYQLINRHSYRIAPVVELVAWHVLGGLQTDSNNALTSADGINVVIFKAGARTSFGNGNSIYIGYGRGLTSDLWYRNLFRAEYRHTF